MKRALALCAVLLAVPVLAADGDAFRPSGRQRSDALRYVCQDKTSANAGEACGPIQIPAIAATYLIGVNENNGCTEIEIPIFVRFASDGDSHVVGSLTTTGTTTLRVHGGLPEYIGATLTTLTNCTDLDVVVEVLRAAP